MELLVQIRDVRLQLRRCGQEPLLHRRCWTVDEPAPKDQNEYIETEM